MTLVLGPGLTVPHVSLASPRPGGDAVIRVLSNRADLVSGGDALVEVELPSGLDGSAARIDVGGRDVTGELAAGRLRGLLSGESLQALNSIGVNPTANALVGVITGLKVGANIVSAAFPEGSGTRITITNHPISGPVFAGPQVQPWICATTSNGLGAATDAACDTPTVYSFQYKSSVTGQFSSYDPQNPPADVATTTTDQGTSVPYVVRVEKGVMDRGIYNIAVLFTPGLTWTPWAPQKAWNHKIVVPFGGDCNADHFQGAPSSVLDDTSLSRGFAVLNSNLNVLGQDCNDVVSSEALMMLKEHFVKSYGLIRYTISNGCSGGSMQQHWISSNYPGLLNGIQPSCSYPDIWETMQEAEDCHLLDTYFQQTSPYLWAVEAQQAAVMGYAGVNGCLTEWDAPGGIAANYSKTWLDPSFPAGCLGGGITGGTGSATPPWIYNPQTNPKGVRCTLQDYMVAVFGRRASDGFANRPYDNVGVQYGLNALTSGTITVDQFVDLNQKIGGLDIDWNRQSQRSVADPEALVVAYRSGRVTYPGAAAEVPIIDLRGNDNLEIHQDFHSYVMRARLDAANGSHANQIIWTGPLPLTGDVNFTSDGLRLMDRWLAAIEADTSGDALRVKVVRDKPADAVDACFAGGHEVTDTTICRAAFPYFADPRIAAGGPLVDNILKCQLRPLNRADYSVTFTDTQWAGLQQAFPAGVCAWNLPGAAQQPSIPWMTYAGGPGGRPLGAAPVSVPFGRDTAGPRSTAVGGTAGIPQTRSGEAPAWPATLGGATLGAAVLVLRRRRGRGGASD